MNLFTYTTSITTSTVLLVLALALVLAMVSALLLVELVTCSQKGHVTWNGWIDEVLLVFWFLAGKPMLLAGKFTIPIPTQKL